MARGRTQMRQNQFAEAIATFRQAIDAAEKVGDEGYEALTQSLSMLAFSAGNIGALRGGGRGDLRAASSVYEEHGDMLGMAGGAAEPLRDVVPHQQHRPRSWPTSSG